MARELVVVLTDDLDGGKADETVHFSLDSKNYVIDLSAANAKALREALKPFVAKAREDTPRKEAAGRGVKAKGGTAGRGHSASAVRAWARENGYKVSDRGRVQSEILTAYQQAVGS
ncbi:histone-like nucleoid-structuring protein Lsr2 [Arthrobacter mobilis]|uniref:Lsr2 family protein n=1 Tax=Arthrobacter mobilis TaxID=2724944 RepID=A0A7X6HDM9_9MICC|nr:Lsr2 family protein [Arthrobacter mobilis]NKX55081.1 Lsr2 family protein [Arthrobacter mobilis]